MELLIAKSIGYMLLIAVGYTLKYIGIFQLSAKDILAKVLMYVTLPCAFVANFQNFVTDFALIYYIFIGFVVNIVMILIGYLVARKKTAKDRALYMIECSGYNIGAFTAPVVMSCLPPESVLVASMFDIGNCVISVGCVYPLAKRQTEQDNGSFVDSISYFVTKLLQSIPFDTYIIMLILSLIGVRLPNLANQVVAQVGAPSIILTMLMIGITFEIDISKDEVKDVAIILITRYTFAVIAAAIIWNFPIFNEIIKKVLMVCLVAPVTSISPNYCNMCGCNSRVYGAVSSLTVPFSLVAIMIIMSIT